MDTVDATHRRCRKKVLGGPIADRLKALLAEIAAQYGFETLRVAVEVMPDHVHLFVSAPPKFSPAEIVRYFRRTAGSHGITSRRLKQDAKRAYLRRQYWGEHATLWAAPRGYYVGTAGHTCPGGQCQGIGAEVIKRYINESQ